MKVHAVAKVRLDGDGRVTGVEWGPVNTESNEWHTEPQIADVSEVDADALGDVDVENFPTLLIADAGGPRFLGPVTPQAQTAERLIRGALAGELAASGDAALAERVRALVAERS